MGDEEQNRIMKKLLIISVLALSSSMSMFADFSNRGRYSDFTEHKSSILDILPILFFVGIVGIFLYYGAQDYAHQSATMALDRIIYKPKQSL